MTRATTFENVRIEHDGAISLLVLDRPGQINAFTSAMYREIRQAVRICDAEPSTTVIVLAAEGEVFGVGGDVHEMLEYLGDDAPDERAFRFRDDLPFGAVRACQKPTIAQVSGTCVGGGLGLATACDVAVVAEGTRMGIPEARIGLIDGLAIAALYGHVTLPALRYLLFSGALIDAAEAVRIGLVLECVPRPALSDRVRELAAQFAASSSRAISEYKRILRSYERHHHLDDMIELMLGDPEVAQRIRERFGAHDGQVSG